HSTCPRRWDWPPSRTWWLLRPDREPETAPPRRAPHWCTGRKPLQCRRRLRHDPRPSARGRSSPAFLQPDRSRSSCPWLRIRVPKLPIHCFLICASALFLLSAVKPCTPSFADVAHLFSLPNNTERCRSSAFPI